MAKEWFNKIDGFTPRDKQYLLSAYRNTFCTDDDGQQVFCHLKTILDSFGESDAEKMAARKLWDAILNNCGIVDNLKIVKALSGVAKGFVIPEQEEGKDNLDVE